MYVCRRPFFVVQDFNDHHDSLPVKVHNFYLEFCWLCWQSHPPPCRPRPPRPMCMIHHVWTWTSPQGGTNSQKSPPKSLDSDENICYFVVNSRFKILQICRAPHAQVFAPHAKLDYLVSDWLTREPEPSVKLNTRWVEGFNLIWPKVPNRTPAGNSASLMLTALCADSCSILNT